MHVSLDGYAAGPNGEMDWIITDDAEMFPDIQALLEHVDTSLYGRVTYQMMESYWPTVPSNPASTEHELQHSKWVEDVQKIVFSKTLHEVTWNNTRLIDDNIVPEIKRLKALPGKHMMIFGSPSIGHFFMEHGLIDEYRINVNPVILGAGIPFFKNTPAPTKLKLLTSKTYPSGVLGLHYQTQQNQ